MASPTSRWAMAKRVTESIISITSAPMSRNASAIVVAVSAALMRTSAGWSDVATTTTERSRPSARSRSMNSRTSRPRSPTRQMTLTSASVDRAIIPKSEDLPTPEPAKMPRRWPRPQGTSASSARTPSETWSSMRWRASGSGGEACTARRPRVSRSPPSSGLPRPSRTRPSSAEPTGTETGRPVAVTSWPGASPCRAPSGMSRVRPARKPTTSAGTVPRPRPARTSQTSPISASSPVASTIRPMRSLTRPRRRCRSERVTCSPSSVRRSATRELIFEDLAGALQLGLQGGVDLSLGGAHDGAPARHAALALDLEVLDAAELGEDLGEALADDLEVGGVDQDGEAVAVDEHAQRATDRVDDELRVGGDSGADHLLGQAQRQLDGRALGGVGQRLALGDERLRGAVQARLSLGDRAG